MADKGKKQVGKFTLDSFMISNYERTKNIEIRPLVHTFNIEESMLNNSVRGTVTIYDGLNILKSFPFIGEEFIEITYTDYFEIKRTDTFFVYAITDVRYSKEVDMSIVEYVMHFVSVPKVYSDNKYIAKTYKFIKDVNQGLISDYVEETYKEYFKTPVDRSNKKIKTKEIVVEKTDGVQKYVIPNYSPEETMNFFSRYAFTNSSDSNSWRFFENREKYYFATYEYMETLAKNNVGYGANQIDPKLAAAANRKETPIPIFRKSDEPDLTVERQHQLMHEFVSIDFSYRVNTIDDINSGSYNRITYEIDVMNGTVSASEYNHRNKYKEKKLKLIHTDKFLDDMVTYKSRNYVMKDYAAPGATSGYELRNFPYYTELYNAKSSYFYHYERNKVPATIYGRNSIYAGSIIDVELFESGSKTDKRKIDKEKSGRYIVESVNNIFYENDYTQEIILTRSGIGA
jgi:hypothetical protein